MVEFFFKTPPPSSPCALWQSFLNSGHKACASRVSSELLQPWACLDHMRRSKQEILDHRCTSGNRSCFCALTCLAHGAPRSLKRNMSLSQDKVLKLDFHSFFAHIYLSRQDREDAEDARVKRGFGTLFKCYSEGGNVLLHNTHTSTHLERQRRLL